MGQIAEDMTDGTCCDLCGCYFVDKKDNLYTHEHSATCKECYDELEEQEREFHNLCDEGITTA